MIKVFIVDDHQIIREGLKRILNAELDIKVVGEADNGDEVLTGIINSECNILLLDLNIPGISGSFLIEEILKKNPSVKVLVLSINPEDEFVFPLLRSGASGYVCKNSDVSELIIAIRKVYDKGRYLSKIAAEKLAFNVLNEDIQLYRNLTPLEHNIMLSIANGKDYIDVAKEFEINIYAVYACKRKIFEKLNLKNDVELTLYAQKHNLIMN